MNIIVALFILGIIVIIHELGHFLLAKKNGITVTEFSVGMGPRIASFVRKGTRYSLKLLPIGGSCMMLGEDETVEDEGAFHKKGVWARFSVIFAGAFFNFLFAFILSLILLSNIGVDKPYVTEVTQGGPAEGKLTKGDMITKVNGSVVHFGSDIDYYFFFNSISDKPVSVTVLRDGKKTTETITPVNNNVYLMGFGYSTVSETAKLDTINKGYPAEKAGMKVGDVITGVNGTAITSGADLKAYFEKNPLSDKEVEITYLRAGDSSPRTARLTPKSGLTMGFDYNITPEKANAFEIVEYSVFNVRSNIVNTLKSVLYLITGKFGVNDIAGPVGIVNYVGEIVNVSKSYGVRVMLLSLIQFSILISANLGVMNLLPLPALDGGRLVFLVIEAIRRKPVSKEKEAMVHMVGFVLLMIFMVFVMYNDIRNILVK